LESYSNKYGGLPDFSNSHGQLCPEACESHAISLATILEALKDLDSFKKDVNHL